MATRNFNNLIVLLLVESFFKRTVFANRINRRSTDFNSHSQMMTDMPEWENVPEELIPELLPDNDTKLPDLARKRRYFQRNRTENDTRATSQKLDEKSKLCIFKPTEET